MTNPLPPAGNLPPHLMQGSQSPIPKGMAGRIRKAKETGDTEALRKIGQDFEAIFVRNLISEMRKSVPKSEFLGGGFSMDTYKGMLDEAIAEEISKGRGIGIGKAIFRQLSESPSVHRPGLRKITQAGAPAKNQVDKAANAPVKENE